MQDYFYKINTSTIRNKTIIVDVDGTLVSDGKDLVEEKNTKTIERLLKNNDIFICSNSNIIARNKKISDQLKVNLLNTPFKKPNKKIISSIKNYRSKDFVVVGDKYITDGIFAKRINASFIKVRRIQSKKESIKTRLVYLFDDIIYFFSRFLSIK